MAKLAQQKKREEQIISFSDKTDTLKLEDLLRSIEPKFKSKIHQDFKDVPTNTTALCLAIVAAIFAIFGITAAGTVIVPLMKGSGAWAIWQLLCAAILIKAGLMIVRGVKCALCAKQLSKHGCSKNC